MNINIVNRWIWEVIITVEVHFDKNIQEETSKLGEGSLRMNPKSL